MDREVWQWMITKLILLTLANLSKFSNFFMSIENVQKIVHLQQPALPAWLECSSSTSSRFPLLLLSFFIDIVCMVAILSAIFPPAACLLARMLSVYDSRIYWLSWLTRSPAAAAVLPPTLFWAPAGMNAFEKQLKLKYSAFVRFTFVWSDKPTRNGNWVSVRMGQSVGLKVQKRSMGRLLTWKVILCRSFLFACRV